MQGKPTVIKFFAPVIDETVNVLINTVDEKMRQGTQEFILLISSPGGDAFYGLSAYNYLKGLPVTLSAKVQRERGKVYPEPTAQWGKKRKIRTWRQWESQRSVSWQLTYREDTFAYGARALCDCAASAHSGAGAGEWLGPWMGAYRRDPEPDPGGSADRLCGRGVHRCLCGSSILCRADRPARRGGAPSGLAKNDEHARLYAAPHGSVGRREAHRLYPPLGARLRYRRAAHPLLCSRDELADRPGDLAAARLHRRGCASEPLPAWYLHSGPARDAVVSGWRTGEPGAGHSLPRHGGGGGDCGKSQCGDSAASAEEREEKGARRPLAARPTAEAGFPAILAKTRRAVPSAPPLAPAVGRGVLVHLRGVVVLRAGHAGPHHQTTVGSRSSGGANHAVFAPYSTLGVPPGRRGYSRGRAGRSGAAPDDPRKSGPGRYGKGRIILARKKRRLPVLRHPGGSAVAKRMRFLQRCCCLSRTKTKALSKSVSVRIPTSVSASSTTGRAPIFSLSMRRAALRSVSVGFAV